MLAIYPSRAPRNQPREFRNPFLNRLHLSEESLHKFKARLVRKAFKVLRLKKADTATSSPDTDTTEEEIDEDSPDDGRCQWDIIRDIPLSSYKTLLLSHDFASDIRRAYVFNAERGSYHYAVFIRTIAKGGLVEEFVIKIPGHGTPERWTAADEYMLNREVDTMRLVRANTSIPAPEIMAWSATLDNGAGFPYIIMRRLPGTPASHVWFGDPQDPSTADKDAEFPSLETEKKRINFLRSLAGVMTELNKLRFEGIGMPRIRQNLDLATAASDDEYKHPVDVIHVWPYTHDAFAMDTRPPWSSIQDYVRVGLEGLLVPEPDEDGDYSQAGLRMLGTLKVMKTAFSHDIFKSAPNDTFILRHDDLDFQNILTDTEGNVTGIIDWDGSVAMPRCVGSAALPMFLRRDWLPGHLSEGLHMFLSLPRYRDIYAAAMHDAGNIDAKFTTKSGIYQAAFASIYEGGSICDLADKLVNLVMVGLPCKAMDFLIRLGDPRGWESIKPILHDRVNEILEPELPSVTWSQITAKLADRAALEWMADLSGIDELDVMYRRCHPGERRETIATIHTCQART